MTAPVRPFVDTNVLLYLVSDDEFKAARAEALLERGVVISVQVLNEFAHVARRKRLLDWDELAHMSNTLRSTAEVVTLTVAGHERGLALARRYRLPTYDAMIAAAALLAGCTTLLSEDFQTGQVFDHALTVRNPFTA